ncbi:non-ribosomal peptide synthetase [Apiospora kogelbergensis]|uniref:Non-ribosomal peptide synthetase n=1 Tax=Apiospora kogelbergensis TaxID=1337665 RepID=A0AAW0QF99_9PEZI
MASTSDQELRPVPVGQAAVANADLSDPLCFSFGTSEHSAFPTVTSAFFYHAESRPADVAARDLSGTSPREITYSDLASRSRRLALQLRNLGVKPGDRVPLVVKRSIEMLVGIFAVLACGAQYVPLDGGVVPDSVLRVVLQQSGGGLALCLSSTEHRIAGLDGLSCKVVIISDEGNSNDLSNEHESYPFEDGFVDLAREDHGCYVIYTSGTTGTPKGVNITHKNVTNLVCLAPGNLGIQPGTRVGSVLNISFDMAAWEVLGCLCNGGTLVMRGSKWEPALEQVDVLICTPSILAKYSPEAYPSIKVVATAGEPSGQRIADIWATHGTYYNCCGPTETTIVNTMQKHRPGADLTIGAPTPNNSVYVLDEDLNPVAIGEPGVMWAGGHGISRGYVGLPAVTLAKYKPDIFANDGSLMYNTGDLGRWRPDGTLDILGRVDDQVKVKGFRVELDGISASMNSFPGVNRATALLVLGEIHGFLEPASVNPDALREHLAARQPYYAVPSHFHRLDALPETGNGKLDKKALRRMADPILPTDEIVLRSSPSSSGMSDTTANDSSVTRSSRASVKSQSSRSPSTSVSSHGSTVFEEKPPQLDLTGDIPDKKIPKPFRGVVYRIFIVYRFLFSIIGLLNVGALIAIVVTGVDRQWFSNMTAINLALAVMMRQDFVINAIYTVCCSVPKSWPLFIRRHCAKVYHFGGMHSSAAVCAGIWLLVSSIASTNCQINPDTCVGTHLRQSLATTIISRILIGLFFFMFLIAYPTMRKRYHDLFERSHRFVGWTMLGLFWVQVVLSTNDTKPPGQSLSAACLRVPALWLLVLATCCIASSWLFLRKVPVDAEVLSNHAVRLHFDYTVPVNGSFTRISRRPLVEWHSFATIPAPQPANGRSKGYSLVVSNAGDWTKSAIQNPPTHLWVRGVPTCGVMRIATLFRRVVVIATGSGIGPLLGHIQDASCPTQLIWSTPNPEDTFGKPLLNTIREKIPDAVIHDTKVLGRPDLVRMGYNLARGFGAEAVIIIANEKITKKVVYGLETRGMPAYGAIWDS